LREEALPPYAPAMLDSMRAIGYSFEAALADIVDNSVAAEATRVDVQFRTAPTPYVAVIDDGAGMTSAGLLEAMRHGGVGPHQTRSERDLGRFGLGMKTASLSQCRRLTVVSRRDGATTGARWDLDVVAARQNWVVQLLDAGDVSDLPHVRDLDGHGSGTVVLWELFDRALAGEAQPDEALGRLVDQARDHLALAFHRFLSGDDGGPTLAIAINNQPLPTVDPFLKAKRATRKLPPDTLVIDGSTIEFRPFILPHITKLSRDDLALAGGEEGLRRYQGFYVYRARRLITFGTWFRLLRQGELTKLARVQIDIPNSLDHLWALDVKKSTAFPPEAVRAGLLMTIERIGAESRNVFTFRGERVNRRDIQHIWRRVDVRGGFNYEIGRDHPVVLETAGRLEKAGGGRLEPLLRAVEMALPVDSIYSDMASDRVVQPAPSADEAEAMLFDLASRLVSAVSSLPDARVRLLDGGLLRIDIFANNPEATKRVIARLRREQ
jgi:Histidine kinase-, DNA gyrase B-, and HSP90-like ATPase